MSGILDAYPITHDPVWPWSLEHVGGPALVVTSLLLLGAAAWSYLRAPASRRRVAVVLGLRLFALVLVFLALSGTSCVSRDELRVPSVVLIAVDASASMSAVNDEADQLSRWDYLQRVLQENRALLDRLRDEYKIQFVFVRFGEEVGDWDPDDPGKADGKRTDHAQLLRVLYDKYRTERYLRALIVFGDGADNMPIDLSERKKLTERWRNLPCPIHTYALGSKNTTEKNRDILVTAINPDPSVVAAKNKLTVKGTVVAYGYPNQPVHVRVYIDGKFVKQEEVTLRLRKDDQGQVRYDNDVQVVCDAPAKPGEYRVALVVCDPDSKVDDPQPLPGELSAANNRMETFITVTREGLSVLLVERQERYPEPQLLLSALAADKQMRVRVAWLRGQELLTADQKGLFQFDQQPYDVIILGDVTAARLKQADPDALNKIYERVEKHGTGLLMMGGPTAFGNGDWVGTPIEKLLPVRLKDDKNQVVTGQIDAEVLMQPTPDGLAYVLRLGNTPDESKALWAKVQEQSEDPQKEDKGARLQRLTRLGAPVPTARVLADSLGGEPILVARDFGSGRTMAFAGDSTNQWIQPDNGGELAHSRFWRQAVRWLAHQDKTDDLLRIRPRIRRLRTGDELTFGVELRGKQGEEAKEPRYTAKIIGPLGPKQQETPVEVVLGSREARSPVEALGKFKPLLPGEYKIEATGNGKDGTGKPLTGRAEARFLAYQSDAELTDKAAAPGFLKDLSDATGGKAISAESDGKSGQATKNAREKQLRELLEQLPKTPLPNPPPKPTKFPDWRANKGRSPFLVAFFLLFVQVLALEWFLRRRWGMV